MSDKCQATYLSRSKEKCSFAVSFKKHADMKKTFLCLVLCLAAFIVFNYRCAHEYDDETYLEQLERKMTCADWQTHYEPTYGYGMRCLSCFRPVENDGEGSLRFAYVEETPLKNIMYITLETATQPCRDSLNPALEVREMAQEMGGVCIRKSDSTYLVTAELKSRDPKVTAYRMNAKYVLHQKLWFIETLIYPEDFAPAVRRLVDEVNRWQPF